MAKPYLSRYAPVAEILYPVKVYFLKPLRRYLHCARFSRLTHPLFERALFTVGKFCLLVHHHEPLSFDLRLDGAATAARGRHIVQVLLVHLDDKSLRLEFLDYSRARLLDMLTGEFSRDRKKDAPFVYHLLGVEFVLLGKFEVVRIVCRRDGHGTGAERHVDALILDDGGGDRAVDPFQFKFLAVGKLSVPLVGGMHHHIFVAEFRFGPDRCDDERAILQVVKGIEFLHVLYLVVRNGGLELRIPVDDA